MQEMGLPVDRALGEEIQLREESEERETVPSRRDVDIHNEMLLLMEIGKARIDTVQHIEEDAEVEMIRE